MNRKVGHIILRTLILAVLMTAGPGVTVSARNSRRAVVARHTPATPETLQSTPETVQSRLEAARDNTSPTAAPLLPPSSGPTAGTDTAGWKKYPFVQFVDKDSAVSISDERFYDISGKIVFPVNKYTLPTNSPILKVLENEVLPMINRDSLQLRQIMIRGAASPEGPLEFNRMLGDRRGRAFSDFINSRLDLPAEDNGYTRSIVAEDYINLCWMMREAGDPDFRRVDSICAAYYPDRLGQLKRALQSEDGGILWNRLLRQYFPELRTARFVLFFNSPTPSLTPVWSLLPANLQTQASQAARRQWEESQSRISVPVTVGPWRKPRRELLSVKTNLLFYGFYMPSGYDRWCPIPNVAVEYYPLHGHFTYGASFDCPWWQDHFAYKFFEIRNYQLEARYYFRSGDIRRNLPGQGKAFRGLYLQAYAHGGIFDICLDANRGWEGEAVGGGLGVGYVLPLSRTGRWSLEFALQAGYLRARHDPYQWEDPVEPTKHDNRYYYKWTLDADQFQLRQYRFNWFGPTRVGISLSYNLLYRRNAGKGFGLRKYEYEYIKLGQRYYAE